MEKRKKGANRVVYHRRLLNHFRETDADNDLLSFQIPNVSKKGSTYYLYFVANVTPQEKLY